MTEQKEQNCNITGHFIKKQLNYQEILVKLLMIIISLEQFPHHVKVVQISFAHKLKVKEMKMLESHLFVQME